MRISKAVKQKLIKIRHFRQISASFRNYAECIVDYARFQSRSVMLNIYVCTVCIISLSYSEKKTILRVVYAHAPRTIHHMCKSKYAEENEKICTPIGRSQPEL